MKLTTLIHLFDFEGSPDAYARGARLTVGDGQALLKADPFDKYNAASVTTDNQITLGTLSAAALRTFTGFQAKVHHAKVKNVVVTTVKFKLAVGATDYYWNGSAWVADSNVAHWNTENELSEHVATFSAALTAKSVTVKAQLSSTDKTVTPRLEWVKLGFRVDTLSFQDDILRTLATLAQSVPFVTEFNYTMPATASTLDLADVITKAQLPGFVPLAADSVFDFTADPTLITDKFASMGSGTVVNLTGPITSGHTVRLRVQLKVAVIIEAVDQDFLPIQQVPQIQFRDPREIEGSELPSEDHVTHKATGLGDVVAAPMRATLEMDVQILAPNSRDGRRMIQRLTEMLQSNPRVTSADTGETYRLWLRGKFAKTGAPVLSGLYQAKAVIQVVDVLAFRSEAALVQKPLVLRVNASYTKDTDRETVTSDSTSTTLPPLGDPPN